MLLTDLGVKPITFLIISQSLLLCISFFLVDRDLPVLTFDVVNCLLQLVPL